MAKGQDKFNETESSLNDNGNQGKGQDHTQSQAQDKPKDNTADDTQAHEEHQSALDIIKQNVHEEDPKLSPALNLRTILGGDILNAELVRSQLWLIVIVVLFTTFYVAFRYQCQQDMITIDRLETELKDAKYKALSSSSTLTERCRESHVLEILKANKDSLLQISDQPPYIINVPEE